MVLYWKDLPRKILVENVNQKLPQKDQQNCVMSVACANLTGLHKISITLIGKSEKPCFKQLNMTSLPVKCQFKKQCMDGFFYC